MHKNACSLFSDTAELYFFSTATMMLANILDIMINLANMTSKHLNDVRTCPVAVSAAPHNSHAIVVRLAIRLRLWHLLNNNPAIQGGSLRMHAVAIPAPGG